MDTFLLFWKSFPEISAIFIFLTWCAWLVLLHYLRNVVLDLLWPPATFASLENALLASNWQFFKLAFAVQKQPFVLFTVFVFYRILEALFSGGYIEFI